MVRLALPGRRLIAYLALRGQPGTREIVSSALWPDVPDEVGRANLRRALWHLPPDWVVAVGDELVLQAESDLAAAHAAAGRALNDRSLTLDEIDLLSSDILPGWHEEWATIAQDAFHLLRVQALEAACLTMTKSGEFALATQAGAAALAAEPLRESAAAALIEAHLARRNRYEAIQCYKLLAGRLRDELGVKPDPALAQRVAAIGQLNGDAR